MYPDHVRKRALSLLSSGLTLSVVSRELLVSRAAIRDWSVGGPRPERPSGCPRCSTATIDSVSYAALLGYYLGDGCISQAPRYFVLRVSCDQVFPGIVADVAECMASVRPARPVHQVKAPGCVVVQANWKHWPCLFPQHGPGRKHERPIVPEEWQRRIVESHYAAFLRGLFHSDGCRVRNWATRPVAGQIKRYDYPRWQFTNYSLDIRELCCWALNLADIGWRQSSRTHISVSTRADVAKLDELIGRKQ